ncbi:hypothetical protein [Kandleria vitulina]|jgi:2-dehydropantoate 2-reductase|nr:hypothetical protein [Kandleria vitulina]
MFEWIWIHMAINAGVTSTAGRKGDISHPNELAEELMSDAKALTLAVKTIRETLKCVEARDSNREKKYSRVFIDEYINKVEEYWK